MARKAIGHHHMDVCAGVGKRGKSVSKNPGSVVNLFSPQNDLFNSHCHSAFLLPVPRIASRLLVTDSIADRLPLQVAHRFDASRRLYQKGAEISCASTYAGGDPYGSTIIFLARRSHIHHHRPIASASNHLRLGSSCRRLESTQMDKLGSFDRLWIPGV